MNQEIQDLIIIGSGPAGYTAAIYAARANLKPIVFAGSVTAGGELMNTTEVENYPGFPEGIQGPDLMDKFQTQAEKFGANVQFEDVTSVELTGEIKEVRIADGTTYQTKSVIIATGSAHRELGLEGEKQYSGKGVSYCATCDGFFFKDKQIIVVGGGDSALEEALFLTKFGRTVTIIHRRDSLRASKIMQDRALSNNKINFVWDSEVSALNGDGLKLTEAVVRNIKTGEESSLPADGLFVAIGHDPRVQLFQDVIALDDKGYIAVEGRSSLTNITGVFAAGDVTDPHYRQAITAAASGTIASIDAEHYLSSLQNN